MTAERVGKERERLDRLRARRDYLQQRVDDEALRFARSGAKPPRSHHMKRGELSAIRWAVSEIERTTDLEKRVAAVISGWLVRCAPDPSESVPDNFSDPASAALADVWDALRDAAEGIAEIDWREEINATPEGEDIPV